MTLGEAILQGEVRAYGQLSDVVRARGGRYADVLEQVRRIFREAGRDVPEDAEIDAMIYESEYLESRS